MRYHKSKFFNEDGNHISTLYSDSATIENVTNNLKAFGNVKVISDSGFVLLSDRILWNNQYKLVTSEDSVMFTNPNEDTLYVYQSKKQIDLAIFDGHSGIDISEYLKKNMGKYFKNCVPRYDLLAAGNAVQFMASRAGF